MILGADYALIGSDLKLVENAYFEVAEGKIKRIFRRAPDRVDVFFDNAVLLPTFINSHIHIADSIAREKAYGKDIFESVVGRDSIKFRALSDATEEELIYGIRTAIQEMLGRGITAFFDFREGGIEGIQILRKALTGNERVLIFGRPNNDDPDRVIELSDGFGLSSLNNYTDVDLQMLSNLAHKHGKYIAAHVSETLAQRAKSLGKYGKSDVMRGLEVADLDIFVHLTYASDSELLEIKKRGKLVVFCPRANMYLGLEFPPIARATELGLDFALGTDNVMLNMPDLFREFDVIVRILRKNGVTIQPKFLLKTVTVFLAKKLGLKFGILEEDMYADFMVFDLTRPNVCCVDDIYKAIVLRGSPENIKSVYVNGQKVFERG